MSNFIKGGFVTVADGKKLTINSNDIVEKRLEELRSRLVEEPAEHFEEGFSEGLDPLLVERLVSTPEEDEALIKAGGALTREDIEARTREAEAEAEQILEAARKEAEQIRGAARDEGREEGYREGKRQAEEECREQYKKKERECEERARAAEADFLKKSAELEPLLVDKIAGIYERVTGARLENDRETVLFLLKRALTAVESGRNYIVHVSVADYENVKAQKEELAKGTGILPESFELVEDGTLSQGACLIESEGGVWDCSLGTQLKLLSQQLRILSYE
ncbi:MAG: hypothetical protein IK115_09255 [Lachnospiraceae bacterium]|nr:hypothetical protein [Lachnospiraceae bacterium]